MIALFLLLVIVAIVLGIVGVVVKGLLYLLIIGIVVFLGALLLGALRLRRAGRRPPGSPSVVINAPTRAWSGRAGHHAPGAPRRPTSPRERASRCVIRPSRSRGTGCR